MPQIAETMPECEKNCPPSFDIPTRVMRQPLRTSTTKGNAPNSLLGSITGRQVREFAQLDSQQNLLKQLKGLLAGHQSAKLGNMEQTLQGNDSFYYVLPGLLPQRLRRSDEEI